MSNGCARGDRTALPQSTIVPAVRLPRTRPPHRRRARSGAEPWRPRALDVGIAADTVRLPA
jgi:hypothetical protein